MKIAGLGKRQRPGGERPITSSEAAESSLYSRDFRVSKKDRSSIAGNKHRSQINSETLTFTSLLLQLDTHLLHDYSKSINVNMGLLAYPVDS